MPHRWSKLTAALALSGLVAFPLAQALNAQVLPQVIVTATDASASEAAANTATVTVGRIGDATGAITVGYTVGGTATAGSDYTALTGSVSLAAGATSGTITVTPIEDVLVEASESVVLTLAAGTGYTLGSPNVATVTISDNDGVLEDDEDNDKHADGARPGWGWGDRNHDHFGPPGHGCSAEDSCVDDDENTLAGASATSSDDDHKLKNKHADKDEEKAAKHAEKANKHGKHKKH